MISGNLVNLSYLNALGKRIILDFYSNRSCGFVLVLNFNFIFLCRKNIIFFSDSFFDNIGSDIEILGSSNSSSICCDGIKNSTFFKSLSYSTGFVNHVFSSDCKGKFSTCGISSYRVFFLYLDWSHQRLICKIVNLYYKWSICILDIILFIITEYKRIFLRVQKHSVSCRNLDFLDVIASHVQFFGSSNSVFVSGNGINHRTFSKTVIYFSRAIYYIFSCHNLEFVSSTTMISAYCINLRHLYLFHYRGICGFYNNRSCGFLFILNLDFVFLSGKSIIVISNGLFYHLGTNIEVF